jgi:hypothetical protein
VARLTGRASLGAAVFALAMVGAAPANARTVESRYTPFAPGGSLRDGLQAQPAFGGACSTGSFVVGAANVYRCVVASLVHDPCYLDALASNPVRAVVVCVETPWSQNVVRLRVRAPLDGRYGAPPDGPPWALRLESGRRCVFVSGATTVVDGRRLNYACGERYLFGSPDRSEPTWRIRQAVTPGGIGVRKVSIATAWR